MTTTLRDLLRFAAPPGSRLLTGDEGLHAPVRAVASLRATLPAFPQLQGDELTLIAPAQALALDDSLTLPNIIKRLAEVPVAAIAAIGPIDDDAREAAISSALPLIQLPPGADLRSVERDVMRLILDPDLQIERWAAQLYSDLTQRIVGGGGLDGLLELLAQRTGAGAACYSLGGRLRAQHAQPPARAVFELLRPERGGELQLLGQQVYIQPIVDAGWLALAGQKLDRGDHLAAQQGAAALALELAKEQAVKDAEARVRGDLVRTILTGGPADSASLKSQAAELGYHLDRPHIALVITSSGRDTSPTLQQELERILRQRGFVAPVLPREDSILAFVPVGENPSSVHDLLDALQQYRPITAGLSSVATTANLWPGALDEAEQALALGRRLFGENSVTAFADLGVYRLLLTQRDSPDLWRFYRETLGALVDLGPSGADLIETLDAYFLARGNVSRAASQLHVHRNTLIYRLQRISDITGVDWERAEDQLALQLALRAHRVLQMVEPGSRAIPGGYGGGA